MATRWCLICGGEYIDTIDECPDCEVPLVDERPEQDLSDVSDRQVVYDLADWAAESRVMLEQLLESEGIRRAWEGTTLVVPDMVEMRVDNLVQHVEVTTLPTLDPHSDRVAYDVNDWTDEMVAELQEILQNADVPYEFDEEGDIVTLAEHEERVEALMDAIEFPDGTRVGSAVDVDDPDRSATSSSSADDSGDDDSDDDDDDDDDDDGGADDGVDAAKVLSDLFVSTDRLKKSARDHSGVLNFVAAAETAERMRLPYGFSRVVWKDIVNQIGNVRELLEDDDSQDDDIQQQALDLRNTLRDYV